jgi:hypothetical protein
MSPHLYKERKGGPPALAVISDNLRSNAVHRSEIPSTAYVIWAFGTLISSPLPIYFFLRPLSPRQRNIGAVVIGMIALGLWIGLKKITG